MASSGDRGECVLLVASHTPAWTDMVRTLQADGIECRWVPQAASPADVASGLQRGNVVLVIDLGPDPVRGMSILTAARRQAHTTPVVVVARAPSVELARRIRLSGVFHLALDPVSADEMRGVLSSAFGRSSRTRAEAGVCRAARRILIVDDDADFALSTTTLLESQGYVVSAARSAKEGLEKVLVEAPDLIVLDVMMEHESAGYQLNQALKYAPEYESFRHVPILMVSSIPIDPARRFRMAGEVEMVTPNSYLTKPVNIQTFLSEIHALLGDRSDTTQV